MRKLFSVGLATLVLFTTLFSGVAAAENAMDVEQQQSAPFSDVSKHWAKTDIDLWGNRGVVKGTSGQFQPEREITRGEWAALINRIFQYQSVKDISFSDVLSSDWFYKDIQVSVSAGYMKGNAEGNFNPKKPITRQEAAVTIAQLLSLQGSEGLSLKDSTDVATWAKSSVGALVKEGLMKGYVDGTFQPAKALTRAEAISILNRAFNLYGTWYGEQGTFGPEDGTEAVKGSVIIDKPGVSLQNLDIAGDLIIGKGVGDGDVYLKNVTVRGKTFVYGGGEHSIHLENVVMVTVIVNKLDGTVRLVAKGTSVIQEVTLQTGANVETEGNADINRVNLDSALPEKSRVILAGHFDTVNIEAKSLLVQIPQGSVDNLNLGSTATGTTIDTSKEASILNLILNAAASLIGKGTIQNATINSTGISMEQAPQKVVTGENVPKDVSVNIGGLDKPAGTITAPQAPSPSNGNNNSGENNDGNEENNGDLHQPYDGGTWYTFGLNDEVFSVSQTVYVTSPRNGTAYILRGSINDDVTLIEAAVQAGQAKKVEVQANVRTPMSLTGFDYYYYYRIVIIDANGKFSYGREITILDGESVALSQTSFVHYGTEKEYFEIEFNRDLKLVEGKDLKTSVTLSTYGSTGFSPMIDEDQLTIVRNKLVIKPANGYLGKSFQFKLLADNVETLDGEYQNMEFISQLKNSFVKVEMIDPVVTNNSLTVPAGTVLKFKVNMETTVYFVLENTWGGIDAYEDEVADGRGLKAIVPEANLNDIIEFNTANLVPGKYKIQAWNGHIVWVTLTAAP
ncbi:S-layer homology domain-containing protein [Cohnella luojiensis]|uniref:SLH domain-containing protein n=1 Tax=Cohnella luojiensis TaxID=652876 RepID=A0A4Y8M4B1_9BACL|nr:S-layer homology domain-containing protein [Cohnella luojiensis]TFE29016.1 hypothetical protein E2980_06400 [Cohnella luojiensis]